MPAMNFVGINVNPMAGGRQFVAPVPIERISFVKEIQVRSLSVSLRKAKDTKKKVKFEKDLSGQVSKTTNGGLVLI